jgi:PAS domain S-box-containing protein
MKHNNGEKTNGVEEALETKIEELQHRLREAEETLRAIRTGGVDALAIQGTDGTEIYTLRTADHTYRVLIEEMNEGAVILSNDNMVLFCNSAFGKMVDVECDDVTGTPFLDYVTPSQQSEFKKYLDKSKSQSVRIEASLLKSNRKPTPAEISIKTVNIDGTEVQYLVVSDISERKKAERRLVDKNVELEKSNSDLEQFAYVASHDLQEPLRMVSSYTTLLLKRIDSSDLIAKEFADFIREGATRMQKMLKDLLAYSRVGRVDVRFEQVDLNMVLEEELHNMREKIEEVNVKIDFGNLPTVNGVRSLLGQIFQNLISNAIKFRHKERPLEIKIKAEKEDNEWLISVCDNGIGIQKEYADRVYILFQRLHTQDEYPGTGIGLSLVKKAVEFHGGRTWIEPNNKEGVTVYFTLPA